MKISTYHSKPEEISRLLNDFEFVRTSKKVEYCNIPFAFDIETTSFYEEREKHACMYCFVVGINGRVLFGRTWEEAINIFNTISKHYELNENKRIICYVHNLAYEFQFIKDRFNWIKVFATEDRKPLTALTDTGIEFRCSYLLSGYSLELVGKNLTRYKVQKLKGDLDYSLMRHSKTPMTEQEIQYCVNDALVVMGYIQEQIEDCGDITKIPLTKTGYVRKYCRNACLYTDKSHKKGGYKYVRYMDKMHKLIITSPDMYKQLKRAFQGGFTHASALNVRQTISDVTSFDETSAYPSVMIAEQYPMSAPKKVNPKNKEEFEKYLRLYCCIFDIKFYDLEAITMTDNPLSASKCFQKENEIIDNGRIVEADSVTTTLTEQDYFIFKKFYKWKKIIVKNMRIFKAGYLPRDFVSAVLDLYESKTILKGVEGAEAEYMNSKEKLNSCFGMAVTDILQDESTYNGKEWITTPADEDELIKYNKSKNRFLYYPWGVWITAYARRNIFEAIYHCGEDYIYSDTDSVKIRHAEKHSKFFEAYNKKVISKLKRACDFHGFSYDRIMPTTKGGVKKPLGVFDFDGHYKRFKTLGAKRYLVEYDKDIEYKNDKDEIICKCPYSLTVSGLNKKVVIPYMINELCKETKKDIFELFDNELYIKKGKTGKKIHTYIDYAQKGSFIDYLGNVGDYDELSSVHMEEADYSLSLSSEYLDFIIGLKEIIR